MQDKNSKNWMGIHLHDYMRVTKQITQAAQKSMPKMEQPFWKKQTPQSPK